MRIIKQFAIIFVSLCVFPVLLFGQYRSSAPISGDYFGAAFELGLTSFFGDIGEGPADGSYSNNIAYKLRVTKNFNSVVEFGGQISMGEMSGEKIRSSSHLYFHNEFIEYSFDIGINLMSFFKAQDSRFSLYGTVGFGLIDFKVKLYDGTNDSLIQQYGYDGKQSTTEFVIPFGGRAVYHISKSSAVSLQTVLSWVDTDKLDGKTGNDNTDYYNFLSIGYTYKFGAKSSGRSKRGGSRGRLNQSRSRYRR